MNTTITAIFFYPDGTWYQTYNYKTDVLPQWKDNIIAEVRRRCPYDLSCTIIAQEGERTYYYHFNRISI